MFAINKSTLVACVAALALAGLVGAFEVKRCDNNESIQLVQFNASSCPEKTGEHCEMRLGQRVVFDIKFKSSRSYPGESYLAAFDFKTGADLWQRTATLSACNRAGLECPMFAGREYSLSEIIIMNEAIASSAYRTTLLDAESNALLCVEIPAKVL